MALDFGILQPVNIAGNILAGRQEAQRNQLAQQQLAMGGLQQQKAELELNNYKNRQAGLDKFIQISAANGKTGTPDELASSFHDFALSQRDPHLILTAQQMLQAANERKAYMAERQPTSAAPSPSAAGPSAPIDEAMKMDWVKNAPAGVSYEDFAASQDTGLAKPVAARTPVVTAPLQAPGMTPAPVVNNLPAAAVAPVAPVNQLVAPAGLNIAALQKRLLDLKTLYPNVPAAQNEAAIITKQLEDANKVHVIDNNLVNGAGQVIATIPKTTTLSQFERFLTTSELTPQQQTQAKQDWIKKESTHASPISVSYGQEKAEAVDYGKLLVKGFENVQNAANLAQKSLPAIESNLAILDKGFDTGFATETKAAGAKVLAALGVKNAADYATDAQTFLANANAAVLQRQLEQKGPQTEADAQRISATGAQLGNTKEANRFVLNVAKAQLQRDLDQRAFFAKWRATNKTFEGAEDAWLAGPGSKSLFDSPALKKYSVNVVDQIPGQAPASGGFKYLGKESK